MSFSLDDLSLDFAPVIDRQQTFMDQFAAVQVEDLRPLTEEIYDRLDALVAEIDDAAVVFTPTDPDAEDPTSPGWTLGHVIAHLTATLEENAAQGGTLARGAEVTGRPRYETPWETITTAAQVRQRLAESRRMTLAFRDSWPDVPHLEMRYEHPYFGPTNALAFHVVGIFHAKGHLRQLEETLRQASA